MHCDDPCMHWMHGDFAVAAHVWLMNACVYNVLGPPMHALRLGILGSGSSCRRSACHLHRCTPWPYTTPCIICAMHPYPHHMRHAPLPTSYAPCTPTHITCAMHPYPHHVRHAPLPTSYAPCTPAHIICAMHPCPHSTFCTVAPCEGLSGLPPHTHTLVLRPICPLGAVVAARMCRAPLV